jgi:hypothetical protein
MPQNNQNRIKNNGLRGWLAAAALFLGFMLPREILAQPLAIDAPPPASIAVMAPCH